MAKFGTGKGLPCCWCLLPNKKVNTYDQMWTCIMEKINMNGTEDFKPATISVDFEAASIKVVRSKFPGVKMSGCVFHQRQAIMRKIKDLGLAAFYYHVADLQELIHMIYALAYVPLEKVVSYYEEVILQSLEEKTAVEEEDAEEDDEANPWVEYRRELDDLVAYLDYTWIGRRAARTGTRGPPLIVHKIWNQHDSFMSKEKMDSSCSTNNCLERYNRTMKSLVGNHPNVWAFIQSLIGQEGDTRRVFINNVSGMDIDENSGRTQHSKDNRERIQSVVLRHGDLTPTLYLQTIAKLIISKH